MHSIEEYNVDYHTLPPSCSSPIPCLNFSYDCREEYRWKYNKVMMQKLLFNLNLSNPWVARSWIETVVACLKFLSSAEHSNDSFASSSGT